MDSALWKQTGITEHLGFVCNMLSAIGGPQYFERPNFPQDKKIWGTDLPIELERFCPSSLRRFMAFEKPANLVDPLFEPPALARGVQPEDPEYHNIGELYSMIRQAFDTLPQETLFIVPPTSQVDNSTLFGAGSNARAIYNLRLFKTWDRVSAMNAVDEIIEQGEGTLTDGPVTPSQLDPNCHYLQFRQIYIEYALGCDPDDEAAVNACQGKPEDQQDHALTPVEAAAIDKRIAELKITDPRDRRTFQLVNQATYNYLLNGPAQVTVGDGEPRFLNGSCDQKGVWKYADPSHPLPVWPCQFWMGSWDADSLTFYMKGTVQIGDFGEIPGV